VIILSRLGSADPDIAQLSQLQHAVEHPGGNFCFGFEFGHLSPVAAVTAGPGPSSTAMLRYNAMCQAIGFDRYVDNAQLTELTAPRRAAHHSKPTI
jgi:hypothetical protein